MANGTPGADRVYAVRAAICDLLDYLHEHEWGTGASKLYVRMLAGNAADDWYEQSTFRDFQEVLDNMLDDARAKTESTT